MANRPTRKGGRKINPVGGRPARTATAGKRANPFPAQESQPFTAIVGHLTDPVESQRERLGRAVKIDGRPPSASSLAP